MTRAECCEVRVLVVDDSAEFRGALAALISAAPGFTLAGTAGSGREALDLLAPLAPDLVLLDVRMPGLDGIETARLIRDASDEIVVALVTAQSLAELPSGTGSCGAVEVLQKRELSARRLRELWRLHAPRRSAGGSADDLVPAPAR